MRIFCHIPRENWFADRFGDEFEKFSNYSVSFTDLDCDVIWLLAAWCWKQIPKIMLQQKPVMCTIHHEVPDKFFGNRLEDFIERDKFVDVYHVPSSQTAEFISKHTNKPIVKIGYWLNHELWRPKDKNDAQKILGLPNDKFFVGSFQRDTEGSDLKSPKLEKGPDRFCDFVEKLAHKGVPVHVLLNGWRRQYVINRLETAKIPYTYAELPPQPTVANMYAACDLYVVGSRYEGGPQSILEASAMKVPIISTRVGMAPDVLPETCLLNMDSEYDPYIPDKNDVQKAYENVHRYCLDRHVKHYDKALENLSKGLIS